MTVRGEMAESTATDDGLHCWLVNNELYGGHRIVRRIALTLFIFGLLLEAAAFLLSNANSLPLVSRIVSRDYVRAQQGLNSLESGEELLPNMSGFEECAELYLSMLREQNPPEVLSGVSVTRFFHPPRLAQNFSVNRGVSTSRPLEIYFSNGQKVDSTLESLSKKINRLKSGNLLYASVVVFASGVLLQLAGFAIQRRREPNGRSHR